MSDANSESFSYTKGLPYPLGISRSGDGINLSLASKTAQSVTLCLFERETMRLYREIPLSPLTNKTGNVWHICISTHLELTCYAYNILPAFDTHQTLLLDPYAVSLATSCEWGKKKFGHYLPIADFVLNSPFDWKEDLPPNIPLNELIIYEMHVRSFTKHSSSQVKHPGTFLGIIEKIPYLVDLGINAVELMPVQEFNELEFIPKDEDHQRYNEWGYSTVNFFAPMNRYASSDAPGAAINEFKTLVRELHCNGIEVILDIVFNHTAEGNEKGSVFSFKGIDNAIYYILDSKGHYLNFSGCGNSFSGNHPVAQEFIISCLRYWVSEMHVDGFRFDLASELTRDVNGHPMGKAPLIDAITNDPVLAKVKLIAEPWDAAGLYQVGSFAPETARWSEWNGKYRDDIRHFIKGSAWSSGNAAKRLCGSEDLYHSRGPYNSINFITCHDGFTLADLVAYNTKHNMANGEHNLDGNNSNESWNCGIEGPTSNKNILALREKQMRNFHLLLMLSIGVPMLSMGDEYGHSKYGNNNTWCHDNDLNWFIWDNIESNQAFFRFYRALIHFRKEHAIFRRTTFLTTNDIDWHGEQPFKPNWSSQSPFLAFTLKDKKEGKDLYVAFNPQNQPKKLQLPPPRNPKQKWQWKVNTANPSPNDVFDMASAPIQNESSYTLNPYSAIVLST